MNDTNITEMQLIKDDIAYVIRNLSRAAYARYDSYDYSAGFFESLAADLILTLPLTSQEYWLDVIQRTTNSLKKDQHDYTSNKKAISNLQECSC